MDRIVEQKLKGRDVQTHRTDSGATDKAVLEYCIAHDAPLLTRDQGDFVSLDSHLDHPGILIDKQLHLRDRDLVADTVAGILNQHRHHLENAILFVSDFYGRF